MPQPDDLDPLAAAAIRSVTPCGDGTMVWRRWGDGPALVLLHGGIGSWRHWVRSIGVFARGHRVIAPDTPGLGDSATPPGPHAPDQIAAIIGDGLAAVLPPGQRCTLVGFSFGALLAGHVAAQHPELITSLTLVGPGALGLPRGDVAMVPVLDKTGAEREQAHRTNLLHLMLAAPEAVDAQAIAIQEINTGLARVRSVRFSRTASLRDALTRVTAPLSVIWGERDTIASPDLPGRIAVVRGLHPAAEISIIPGAGHWVQYEAADSFNAILAGILARDAASGRD
jgi:pimeloyl-ACP methyl ester carboxylesterase